MANGNSVMWRQRGEAHWFDFFSQNNEVLPGCPLNVLTTPWWTTGGRSASQGRTAPSRWSRASSRWTEPARARWRWGRSTFVVGTAYYPIIVKFYHIFLQTYSWRLEYIPLWYKLCEQQIVFLVNCAPWASLASADSCVDDSLLVCSTALYELLLSVSVNTVYTLHNVYSIQTALHCLSSSMYAYIYCAGRQDAIGMGWWASEQNVGWRMDTS